MFIVVQLCGPSDGGVNNLSEMPRTSSRGALFERKNTAHTCAPQLLAQYLRFSALFVVAHS